MSTTICCMSEYTLRSDTSLVRQDVAVPLNSPTNQLLIEFLDTNFFLWGSVAISSDECHRLLSSVNKGVYCRLPLTTVSVTLSSQFSSFWHWSPRSFESYACDEKLIQCLFSTRFLALSAVFITYTSNERQLLLISELTRLICLFGNWSMDVEWIIRRRSGSSIMEGKGSGRCSWI